MENLFTININPDENVRLNNKTEKNDYIKIRVDKAEASSYEESDNSNNLISIEINEICKNDHFDLLGELNDNQINEYENTRKNIRKYVLKCFKEDDIIIDFPKFCGEDIFNEHILEKKNFKLNLRKDKINDIISSSQEKLKKNRKSELNSRYYFDKNLFNFNDTDEGNFVDLIVGSDISLDEIDNQSKDKVNEGEIGTEEQELKERSGDTKNGTNEEEVNHERVSEGKVNEEQVNEGNGHNSKGADEGIVNEDQVNEDKLTEIKENDIENHYKIKENFPSNNTGLNKNKIENGLIKYTANIGSTVNSGVHVKLSNVMEEFQEKIKNWLVKFPYLNSENFFFHLYFLTELYREKRYVCQNCGSFECDKDFAFRDKCKNKYCYICSKHVFGQICHNTKTQYMVYKANVMHILDEFKNLKYPYTYMSCLKCMSNDHLKCGKPPFIFAKYSYNLRSKFSYKLNPIYFVYLKNPLNIWTVSNPIKDNFKSEKNYSQKVITNTADKPIKIYNNNNNRNSHINSKVIYNTERSIPHLIQNKNNNINNHSNNLNVHNVESEKDESDENYDLAETKRSEIRIKYSFNNNTRKYKPKRNFEIYNLDNDYHHNNNLNTNNKRHKNIHHDNNNYVNKNKLYQGSTIYDNNNQYNSYSNQYNYKSNPRERSNSIYYENNFVHDGNSYKNYSSNVPQNSNRQYSRHIHNQDNHNSNHYNHNSGNYDNDSYDNNKNQKINKYYHNNKYNEENSKLKVYNNYENIKEGLYKNAKFTNSTYNNKPQNNSFLNTSISNHMSKKSSSNNYNSSSNNYNSSSNNYNSASNNYNKNSNNYNNCSNIYNNASSNYNQNSNHYNRSSKHYNCEYTPNKNFNYTSKNNNSRNNYNNLNTKRDNGTNKNAYRNTNSSRNTYNNYH
ncbi:conserved Plasmodium protein, unknown function [Plasmodium malariae]|uniref:Uncharacterized protein n=1 Tax=Plasmodium malariae TaxID=5858 RepID=A0A1D3SQ79_PLAMA|nr:conserved Plasmodium protein, unknown function [Plasmodium malariae]SCO94049.1 conserved Plasmodium protein, unknown function [Plasmodium malariae]